MLIKLYKMEIMKLFKLQQSNKLNGNKQIFLKQKQNFGKNRDVFYNK